MIIHQDLRIKLYKIIKSLKLKDYLIAGGFVRDYYIGREFHDIDIYTTDEIGGNKKDYLSHDLLTIIETDRLEIDDLEFNLIRVSDLEDVVPSFTFYISQAWLDENYEIKYTKEFLDDVQNNTLTLNQDINLDQINYKYVTKILDYFPKNRLVFGELVKTDNWFVRIYNKTKYTLRGTPMYDLYCKDENLMLEYREIQW